MRCEWCGLDTESGAGKCKHCGADVAQNANISVGAATGAGQQAEGVGFTFQRSQLFDVTDAVTGEHKTYSSVDELPADIRSRFDEAMTKMAATPGAAKTVAFGPGQKPPPEVLNALSPEMRRLIEQPVDRKALELMLSLGRSGSGRSVQVRGSGSFMSVLIFGALVGLAVAWWLQK